MARLVSIFIVGLTAIEYCDTIEKPNVSLNTNGTGVFFSGFSQGKANQNGDVWPTYDMLSCYTYFL